MKLGIDLGSSNTKSSKGLLFISKITNTAFLGDEENEYFINGEAYQLETGQFDTEFRKAARKDLMNLLYVAIFKSSKDAVNDIVVGLPPGQYKKDQYILKDSQKTIRYQGEEREITIRKVEVLPEGILSTPTHFEGISLDIGGRTSDIALIEIVNGKKTINQAMSLPTGTQNLYSSFIREVNKRGLNLKDNEAEKILRNGLFIWGEKQDIKQEIEIFDVFIDEIIRTLNLDYSLKTNDLIVTGGGGQLLFNHIKKRVKNATLINNSIFANALTFGKYAERKF